MQQLLQVTAESGSMPRVRQSEIDERLEVRIEVADVVAAFKVVQTHAVCAASAADDGTDGVGELDFAPLARRGVLQRLEDGWRQDIASRNGQRARRLGRP